MHRNRLGKHLRRMFDYQDVLCDIPEGEQKAKAEFRLMEDSLHLLDDLYEVSLHASRTLLAKADDITKESRYEDSVPLRDRAIPFLRVLSRMRGLGYIPKENRKAPGQKAGT